MDPRELMPKTFWCEFCDRTLPIEELCCCDGPDDDGNIENCSCVDCDGPIHQGSHARLDVGYWERTDC